LTEIEQLKKENAELKAQIEGAKQPPNDWHSMMYLVFLVLFRRFGTSAFVQHEMTLGAMPPRMDFLIRVDDIQMDLGIFKLFRRFNIIEFKGPDDSLGMAEMCQPIIYFGAAAREVIHGKEGSFDDFTVTLIREAKPEKLLSELVYTKKEAGIYQIDKWVLNVPLQIIVTRELKGTEYAAIRAISKHPKQEDIKSLVDASEKETDPEVKGYYRDLLDLLTKAVPEAIDEERRRDSEMTGAWMKVFAPEIKDEHIKALTQGLNEDAGWTEADAMARAAKRYDVSVEYVKGILHPKVAM